MPKLPYRGKKKDDDEIVSFQSFCNDKSGKNSAGPKQDSLTLNDNINYQLYYEKRKGSGESSGGQDSKLAFDESELKETSLSGTSSKYSHNSAKSKKDTNQQGRFYPQNGKYAFLNRMKHSVPKRIDSPDSSSDKGLKYERFSDSRFNRSNWCSKLPGLGSGILVLTVVCVLCVVVWWGVWGVVGGAWGEEHYRRLWERAHPHHNQNHHTHYSPSVIVHQQLERLDPIVPFEPKYHDHNNLSTKNKNASENIKMKSKLDDSDHDIKKNTVYLEILDTPPTANDERCGLVQDHMRFDCYPQSGASEEGCRRRGCCWVPHNKKQVEAVHYKVNGENEEVPMGLPYCFYPPHYESYHFDNITMTRNGLIGYLERQFSTSYPKEADRIAISVTYLSDDMLNIKIYDIEKHRYEPPYPEIPTVSSTFSNAKYRFVMENRSLGFKVVRVSDGTIIMDSQDIGGLIFSDKFLQLNYLLPTTNIYGLGEHQGSFLLPSDWQRYTLFNYDTAPTENKNLYGSHPFYLAMEKSGSSHGVFLLNSNAMDVVIQPTPAITFRAMGGILNFFVMLGPDPANVVSQYTSLIGRPFMPPFWSLGFHLCKYGYGSLNKTREVWARTRAAGIPFDVQWNDLDYMSNSNDFTYDKVLYKDLPKFVEDVHSVGMHYIPLVDPGVSASEKPGTYMPYDKGIEMDVFVKNSSGLPFVGKVWNKASTVWPDFTHPNTTEYWLEMLTNLHQEIHFDGLWIDMNEPSNFLSGPLNGSCGPEDLPYMPGIGGSVGLRSGTLCMDAKQYAGEHYNLHNLYSLTEAMTSNFALTEIRGKRPFIISRSSFPGLGKYSGHWSGDITSEWHHMKMSIPQLLSFSLFGIPMMGADICGFGGNTTVELCKRWMELGAFYPFSRNHNSDTSIEQDPVALGPIVVEASKKALLMRYAMLPYLYTLFWKAHFNGETVARPLFFEFPLDNVTYSIDQQFMWGSSVMMAPILDPNMTSVKAYLPRELWYKFTSNKLIGWSGWGDLQDSETVLVRGGSILPMQVPDPKNGEPVTTATVRSKPLQLLVALNSYSTARGSLFWDDGISLNTYEERKYSLVNFTAFADVLTSEVSWWGYGVPGVEKITVLGLTTKVSSVLLNNKSVPFTYNTQEHILTVEKLTLLLDRPFTMKWK